MTTPIPTAGSTASEHPARGPGFLRQHLRAVGTMGVIGGLLVGTLLGLTVGPKTPRLGEASTGDPALVADTRAVLVSDRGLQTLSVARVRGGQVSYAGLGSGEDGQAPTPQTPFELGSITKTFTGLLLADAVQRGELAVEDPLELHLPELAGTPAGRVSLFELATHSSGLPSTAPTGYGPLLGGLGNDNPYDVSVAAVIEASKTVELKNQGRYAYSNLGMSLLGHAEARAAGVADWPTLATERLLLPLKMTATTFALSEADVPAGAARPHRENGWRAPHWYGPGYTPAGSATWTTAEDVARYAQALLARKVPGVTALDPEAEARNGSIGLAWQIRDFEGIELTWHNGGTGGTSTMLALDRATGQAAVVLGNSTRNVDRAGFGLAAATGTPEAVDRPALPGLFGWIGTVIGLTLLVSFASAAIRGRDRLAVAAGLVTGLAGLLILLAYGPWNWAPGWIWASVAGAAAALAAYAVLRALGLPNLPAGRGRAVLGVLSAVVGLIVLAYAVFAL